MTFLNAVAAELRKSTVLPATSAGVAVTTLGTLGITLANSLSVRDALRSGHVDLVAYTTGSEAALAATPLGTVGAVILGVVIMSSEYTADSSDTGGGRQIVTTLTSGPGRLTVLVAKALSVALLILATAAVALPSCLVVARLVIGDPVPGGDPRETVRRAAGAGLYWILTGLIALAMTVVTRSGVIPLVTLITNSCLVSVSMLLTRVTSLAYYLPDMAGMRLFAGDTWLLVRDAPDPVTGGLIMSTWTVGLLGVSAAVFTSRDA
jgi:ABC-2 type transport system permease protein